MTDFEMPLLGSLGSRRTLLRFLGVAPISLVVGASCAMEPEQKPPVELRLESPPSPDEIPLSDKERATIQKHPHLGELVRAWSDREFSMEYRGQSIAFPAERAYTWIQDGLVVSVDLFSPNLAGNEIYQLMTSALRRWMALPEEVKRFEDWWRGNRESIVEMRIGERNQAITLGVCPSFNREKPHVFKCIAFWGFPRDRIDSEPAAKE